MPANSRPLGGCQHADALFPLCDRRASHRTRTVCFTVKLDREGGAALFRARNISDTGMMLDAHIALDVDEPVIVGFSEGLAIPGTVQWHDRHRCGIRFEQAIDSAALLHAEAERKRMDRRKGALRLTASRLATSFSDRGIRAVTIHDVSHRGLGLAHDGTLGSGMLLDLVVDSGIRRCAEVRWSEEGRAGLRLLEPLNCREVANIGGFDPLSNVPAPAILRDSA